MASLPVLQALEFVVTWLPSASWPETRAEIESAISNLEEKLKGEDKSAIEAAQANLEKAAAELGKAVYEATSGDATSSETAGAEPESKADDKGDDVIDAEFEVKDN